jgi:hypothetical protein
MSQQASLEEQQVIAASSNILRGVYAPAFLQKLAELGHEATNDKEAEELIALGFKLADAGMQPQPSQSKYASAISALEAHQNARNSVTVGDYQLKAAAAQLAQDPTLYASTLVLQEAEKSAK